MRFVEPEVYLIGRTQVQEYEVLSWLNDIGADKFTPDLQTDQGALLIQLAGKRCYMSFQPHLNPNIEKVREDMAAFIDNILIVGHGSVLEHSVYNFAIENVSRVFTAEMNRHRAGMAISEGSMRYIRFNDIPVWLPTSLQEQLEDEDEDLLSKAASRKIFQDVFEFVEKKYAELEDIWKHKLAPTSKFTAKKQITSMMRRIVPMGVASGGVWSGNLRALRHIFTMRCDSAAEEEMIFVACKMLHVMQQAEPLIFKDFELVDGFWTPKYRKI